MIGYYFAVTDERGVLCVDELDTCFDLTWDDERVAHLAEQYADTIYFWVLPS